MAPTAYSFWFILLLLAGDWYFDTSHGLLPFERPMCSTQVTCRSLASMQQLCKRFEATNLIEPTCQTERSDQQPAPTSLLPGKADTFLLRGADLAYFFMSMQC
jgi:hypothetical protein